MAGFTSRADIVSEALTSGKKETAHFDAVSVNGTIARWTSLWTRSTPVAGANPATTPGTVYATDQSTATPGAMWFPDRSPDLRYLTTFGAVSSNDCTLMLYDRLAGVSGVVLTSTGAKTVNSGALDRYSGTAAINNEVWIEYTTASSTTIAVVTLNSYTTADGSTAQTGGQFTLPTAIVNTTSMFQLPLHTSKKGVRSVETLNVNTATTNGVVNVIIIRPLARIMLRANDWNEINFLDDYMDLPQVFDNATLGLAVLPAVISDPNIRGTIQCVYG